jgi:hypothetical protein
MSGMDTEQKQTDSIPRAALAQVFGVVVYLAASDESSTFDQVRLFLLKKSARAAPASRVAMWTVARDVLVELQKLGYLEAGVLPRTQSLAERNGDTPCRLTDAGRAMVEVYKEDQGRAYDQMLLAWLNQHPYFRTFIARLHQSPLYIPDVTSAKQIGSGRDANVAERVASACLKRLEPTGFPATKADVFRQGVEERFRDLSANTALSELDAKKWVDAIQDRVALPAFLQSEQLPFDAVTFQHVLNAAKHFFAASWTTSHPEFQVRIVYPTSDFTPEVSGSDPIAAVRHHGKSFAKEKFVEALKSAYSRTAKSPGAYANAYEVRALVCIGLQIQPRVFAACLRDLIVAGPTQDLTIYTELPFDPPPPGEEYVEVDRNRIGLLKLVTT